MVYANAVNFPYKTQDFIYSLVKPLYFGKMLQKKKHHSAKAAIF